MTRGTPSEAHGLLLAAGAGTRFGGGKLLARLDGRPLVAHAVRAALLGGLKRLTAVVGADAAVASAIREAGAGFSDASVSIVEAEHWGEGLSASLKAGVAPLPPSAGAAVVFLGDMPRVPFALVPRLVSAWRGGAAAACPLHQGRRGHPVLLSRVLFAQVETLAGDRGAGAILDGLGERLARLETDDPGVLFDVDRPADLG